jgi:hypothetical protein
MSPPFAQAKPQDSLSQSKQQGGNGQKTLTCLLCKEDHRLSYCKQFTSLFTGRKG